MPRLRSQLGSVDRRRLPQWRSLCHLFAEASAGRVVLTAHPPARGAELPLSGMKEREGTDVTRTARIGWDGGPGRNWLFPLDEREDERGVSVGGGFTRTGGVNSGGVVRILKAS